MRSSAQQLVIVADDLTGAADAAAAFGARTDAAVMLDANRDLPDCTVVSVDTDTRHAPTADAASRVDRVVRVSLGGGRRVYNKIDSTLRGNVAVEIRATLTATASAGQKRPCAVVAPAFPATGRTVSGGVVRVDGRPLAARHAGGNLRRLLAEQGLTSTPVDLSCVRAGVDAVRIAIAGARRAGMDAVCVDAESDEDLESVAAAVEHADAGLVPTGSAGLARAMAGRWSLPQRAPAGPLARRGHVLVVLGSYSEAAYDQRAALAPGVAMVALAEPYDRSARERAANQLRDALREGDALLVPDPSAPVRRDRAAEVAAALAQTGSEVLGERHADLAGVILTGGETARAVLLAIGVDGIDVMTELEPGVVFSSISGLDCLPLITKAGAFGDAGTLERARRALHGREPQAGPSRVGQMGSTCGVPTPD